MGKGIPLVETGGDVVEFENTTEVMIQGEGEFAKVRGKKFEVKKAGVIQILAK